MRVSLIVLAAVTAILGTSSSTLAATANGEQAFDSMIAPDQVQPTERFEVISHPKRSLRSHRKRDDVNDEERAKFNLDKFTRMVSDQAYREHRFHNWKYKYNWSDRQVYDLLQVDSNPLLRTLFYKYQKY